MLNEANLNRVISRLEVTLPAQFNMTRWVWSWRSHTAPNPSQLLTNCNTAGCLGGWINAIFPPPPGADREEHAANSIGITLEQANELFFPKGVDDWDHITIPVAINTLLHLKETGEVEWQI